MRLALFLECRGAFREWTGKTRGPFQVMISDADRNAHVPLVRVPHVSYRRVNLSQIPVGYLAPRRRPAYGGRSSGRTASKPERPRIDVGALKARAHDSRLGFRYSKRSAWLYGTRGALAVLSAGCV